jgi:putative sterol carrier protein
MIQFYTKEFFGEIAKRLNSDSEWAKTMAGHDMRIVCSAVDRKRSFLIAVKKGAVSTSEAGPETPADYRFEGKYEAWMQLCKGEAEMDHLIQQGKIRLAGSMADVMGLMGPLNRIVLTARSFPKAF